jgi:hypothetical protein
MNTNDKEHTFLNMFLCFKRQAIQAIFFLHQILWRPIDLPPIVFFFLLLYLFYFLIYCI